MSLFFIIFMEQKKQKIPQIQFGSLEEFIEKRNNFDSFFRRTPWGEQVYRCRPHFERFRQAYPELEKDISDENTAAYLAGERHPYEKLWEAYKLMSEFVYVGDEAVVIRSTGKFDSHKLLR